MNSKNHIHYTRQGDGDPVILIHGFGGSHRQWHSLAPQLAASGREVFALDLLGHGNSAKPHRPGGYDIEMLCDGFFAWMSGLDLKRPPVLVSHSMGAYVALQYALHSGAPLRGLFFASPFLAQAQLTRVIKLSLKRPKMSQAIMKYAPEWSIRSFLLLSQSRDESFPRQIRKTMAEDYKRLHPAAYHLPHSIKPIYTQLENVETPTMFVWGGKDMTLTPESFPNICEVIPRARRQLLPGGHMPHLSHPEAFNRTVLDFLEEIDRQPDAGWDGPPAQMDH